MAERTKKEGIVWEPKVDGKLFVSNNEHPADIWDSIFSAADFPKTPSWQMSFCSKNNIVFVSFIKKQICIKFKRELQTTTQFRFLNYIIGKGVKEKAWWLPHGFERYEKLFK